MSITMLLVDDIALVLRVSRVDLMVWLQRLRPTLKHFHSAIFSQIPVPILNQIRKIESLIQNHQQNASESHS